MVPHVPFQHPGEQIIANFHCLNFVITVMIMCKTLVLILMITLTHLPGPVLPVRLEDVSVKVVFVELLFNEREPDGIYCFFTQSPILSFKSTFKTITAILTYLDTMARPEQNEGRAIINFVHI